MSPKKILNPKTGKMVNINGAIGKKILMEQQMKEIINLVKKDEIKKDEIKKDEIKKDKVKKDKVKKEEIKKEEIKKEEEYIRRRIEIPKELKMMEFKINIKKMDGKEKKVKSGLTLEKFEKLIDNDDFIENFKQNLIKMYKYKIDVYKNKEMLPKEIVGKDDNKDKPGVYDNLLEVIGKELIQFNSNNFNKVLRTNLLDAINNKKFGMKTLIGREEVINKLCSILFAFSKNYKLLTNTFINFAIFGSAGVGKSALAKVFAYTFKKSYIMIKGNVIMGSREELVGQFVGQTANKTRKLLFEGLEGIVFIDEAYSLTPINNEKDFGSEAVAELINFMDKTIGLMIVMVAGYKDKMIDNFFKSNEGLDRRFPNKFTLKPYSCENLTKILLLNLKNADVKVNQETANFLFSIITNLYKQDENIFYNQAGDMLNLCNSIVQHIYMNEDKDWGTFKNNKDIILDALDEFLTNKGYFIRFDF